MWLFQISDGKLAKHVTSSTAPATKKRKVVAMAGPTVAAHFRPADLTHVQQVTIMFISLQTKLMYHLRKHFASRAKSFVSGAWTSKS
jgi:hypothetical protein